MKVGLFVAGNGFLGVTNLAGGVDTSASQFDDTVQNH
jgi:hypothetical protein